MSHWLGKMVALMALLTMATWFAGVGAHAQQIISTNDEIDPKVLAIDENDALGRAINPATEFVDQNGRVFKWGDLAGKPTIVVFAYYTCDGSCSVINATLRDLLKKITRYRAGVDFNLLTISFDHRDNLESTGAFQKHLELVGDLASVWTFATFKNEADLKAETKKIGFKYFWSRQDGAFLHPGAFLFFSPEGALARVLYSQNVDSEDVELAVLDAHNGNFRPSQVIEYAVSLCYSYSYQDGKYHISIPVFVGLGALTTGLSLLAGSALVFRSRRRTELRRV